MSKVIVLLSGGLDSTTTLYWAKAKGYKPTGLIFDYGQRHRREIIHAKRIAQQVDIPFYVIKISMPWLGSSLLDMKQDLPKRLSINPKEIPSTYVPARNIVFLSFAASCAEALDAKKIIIGANAIDYSGYPDCRPEFFKAYEQVLAKGTKTGVQHHRLAIEVPLLHKTKADIVRLAKKLGVPFHLTWSCYLGKSKPCGTCDSCRLRAQGFEKAGILDK